MPPGHILQHFPKIRGAGGYFIPGILLYNLWSILNKMAKQKIWLDIFE